MTDVSILIKQLVIANIRSQCFSYNLRDATEGHIRL